MALLWIDGFEGYGTTSNQTGLGSRYPTYNDLTRLSITTGRITGYGLATNHSSYTPGFTTPVLTTNPTLIVGWATSFVTTGSYTIIQLFDNATLGISVTLYPTSPLSSVVVNLGATTISTYADFKFLLSKWYYIEMKVFCHDTNGTVEVRINGVTVISLSNIDTNVGFDPYYHKVKIILHDSSIDDYYICDGSGTTLNDFQGVCRIVGLLPNADTTTIEWIPSTGLTHYNLIDENPANTTDYVSNATQDQIDLYTYPALVDADAILGLQIDTQVKIAVGSSVIIESPIISNGITELGPDSTVISTNFIDVRRISTTDPNTGLSWVTSNLSAAQIGIRMM
jgi:hypothetical protein